MGVSLETACERWDRGIKLHFPRYVSGEISFQEQRRWRIREVFGRAELKDGEADEFFQGYLGHYVKHWILFSDVLPFLDGMKAKGMPLDGYCDHTAMIADEELHRHYTELLRGAGAVIYGRTTYQLMEGAK